MARPLGAQVCVAGSSDSPLGTSALLLSKGFEHYSTSKMNMDAMHASHTLARFHSILQRSLLLASAQRIARALAWCLLSTPGPPRPRSRTPLLSSHWVGVCDDAWAATDQAVSRRPFSWHFLAPGPQRPIFLAYLASTAFKRERAGLPVKRGGVDEPWGHDLA